MNEITRGVIVRVGVDLAKHVIQVHAVDDYGRVVSARTLSRDKFTTWCAHCRQVAWWPWRHVRARTMGS